MSKLILQSRNNGCAADVQPKIPKIRCHKTYNETFNFLSDSVAKCLINNLQSASAEHVLMTFHAAKEIYSLKFLCTKYEYDHCAIQEGERVVMGLWGHWTNNAEMEKLYNPHPKTIDLLHSIKGDNIAFLRICMRKYSSTLKSTICNCKFPKVYNISGSNIDNVYTAYEDQEGEFEEAVFDRSIVKIAKINRKTKHVQLGFDF